MPLIAPNCDSDSSREELYFVRLLGTIIFSTVRSDELSIAPPDIGALCRKSAKVSFRLPRRRRRTQTFSVTAYTLSTNRSMTGILIIVSPYIMAAQAAAMPYCENFMSRTNTIPTLIICSKICEPEETDTRRRAVK